MLKKTNHTYVFNRQHVFHNGKEMIDNSVFRWRCIFKNTKFIIKIDPKIPILKPVSNDLEIIVNYTLLMIY